MLIIYLSQSFLIGCIAALLLLLVIIVWVNRIQHKKYALKGDAFNDAANPISAEEKLKTANRLYAFISQINQALIHADSEQAIFKEACNIALESGKFKMAWVGLINEPGKTVNLVASAG